MALEPAVTHVFSESVPLIVEVESPAAEPTPPLAEPALDHHSSEALPVKFKPLVFLKSRSESDAPKE